MLAVIPTRPATSAQAQAVRRIAETLMAFDIVEAGVAWDSRGDILSALREHGWGEGLIADFSAPATHRARAILTTPVLAT